MELLRLLQQVLVTMTSEPQGTQAAIAKQIKLGLMQLCSPTMKNVQPAALPTSATGTGATLPVPGTPAAPRGRKPAASAALSTPAAAIAASQQLLMNQFSAGALTTVLDYFTGS